MKAHKNYPVLIKKHLIFKHNDDTKYTTTANMYKREMNKYI